MDDAHRGGSRPMTGRLADKVRCHAQAAPWLVDLGGPEAMTRNDLVRQPI